VRLTDKLGPLQEVKTGRVGDSGPKAGVVVRVPQRLSSGTPSESWVGSYEDDHRCATLPREIPIIFRSIPLDTASMLALRAPLFDDGRLSQRKVLNDGAGLISASSIET